MGGFLRSCLQSLLKLANSAIAMAGTGMVLYSLWMARMWYEHFDDEGYGTQIPWFICCFLGSGISLCMGTCLGHIAAETTNRCCLSYYMMFLCGLVLLEGAIMVDISLNSRWEDDFPEDPSGRFDQFKDFVRSNFEICKWLGILLVAAQGFSILMCVVLKAVGSDEGRYYESDDDFVPARFPLLNNCVPSSHTLNPQVEYKQ